MFPYAYELETQKKFGDILNLYEYICQKIDPKNFDIAMIAAGALAIPFTSYIKPKKKIAVFFWNKNCVLYYKI